MSKSKQEHVEYWVRSSKEDLDTAIFLFSGKRWLYGLFCCHLAVEKICKALWVKSKVENIPPKTHNLLRLLAEAGISYDDEILDTLNKLNEYQIEGRYPGEMTDLSSSTTEAIAIELLSKTKTTSDWLLKKLQ
jgi:HEPN domain-containing protein